MLPDRSDEIWKRALIPVSSVAVEIPRVSLESATADALTNRQELAQLKTNAEINRINERYYRDQTKPRIDLVAVIPPTVWQERLFRASPMRPIPR